MEITMVAKHYDLLIIGDLNIDYLGAVDGFPGPDQEVELKTLDGYLGGSGANAAVVAKRLGLEVAFFSAVGDDASAKNLLELIRAAGISTEWIKQAAGQASGMVFGAIAPDGERRLFSFRGANLALFPSDLPVEIFRRSQRLHLNGPEFSLAQAALGRSRELGMPNSMDPGAILISEHGERMDTLLALTDILFVNQAEFAALAAGSSDAERAQDLHRRGVKWLVVKAGASGSRLFRPGEQELKAPAYAIQAIDTTGAGDAFNAAFLDALLRGLAPQECLQFANAVGALASLAVGATSGVPAGREAVEIFINRKP
jgi:ribokinase